MINNKLPVRFVKSVYIAPDLVIDFLSVIVNVISLIIEVFFDTGYTNFIV